MLSCKEEWQSVLLYNKNRRTERKSKNAVIKDEISAE